MERAATVMMTDDCIAREMAIHGAEWASAHGGYFDSAELARRYQIGEPDMSTIRARLVERFGHIEHVFLFSEHL